MNIFKIIEIIQEAITYGGCYEIKNLNSGGKYVGETLDFFTRMNTHTFFDLYSNRHHFKESHLFSSNYKCRNIICDQKTKIIPKAELKTITTKQTKLYQKRKGDLTVINDRKNRNI